MKDYAVVKIRGKQYKVSQGDEILVPGIEGKEILSNFDVLLKVKNGSVVIGKPYLKSDTLKMKVLSEGVRGDKITVFKYKAKSRYRKKIGFREIFTKLLIESI